MVLPFVVAFVLPITLGVAAAEPPESPEPAPEPAPELAGWKQKERVVRDSPYDEPVTVTLSLMGGALFSGGPTLRLAPGLYSELSLGFRVGLSSEPYLAPTGMLGLALLPGQRATRHGLFLRGGSTWPMPRYHEVFVAGGYALRARLDDTLGMGLDLGMGWMPVHELPVSYDPSDLLFLVRLGMDIDPG